MKTGSEIFASNAHENDWCKCGCKSELCTMLKDVRNWVSRRPRSISLDSIMEHNLSRA